jgi:DNA polymerase-1
VDALSLFDAALEPLVADAPAARPDIVRPSAPAVPEAAPAGPLLLAVDGNSLAHRAFHAYGSLGLGAARGGDRSALYGFLALLTALHDKTDPDAVVVGFDCRDGSRRRDRYAEYKAGRAEKDPALYALLDLVPALLDDLGVEVVVAPGWEADDVVGSAAATAEAAGWRCVVATSDKDAFGLISPATTVLRLRSGLDNAVVMDPDRLRREVGVPPDRYVELAALRGDPSDNLKGVHGIGPSRAVALLSAYPGIAEAVADPIGCRSVIGPGPGQALIDDLAAADSVFRRNVELMTIRRDVPISLDACRRRRTPEAIAACLEGWGLGHLATRTSVALAVRPESPPLPGDADAPL